MLRVLVTGAGGRMGREVVRAITAEPGMEVVACVDTGAAGVQVEDGSGGSHVCAMNLAETLLATAPDVMVDFTAPDAVEPNLRVALAAGIDCVVGTTGLTEERLADIVVMAPEGTCLFYAPNFAIGAVLMMEFARQAARYLPHAEIVEMHHDRKADAPSGTAIRTARLIAGSRGEAPHIQGKDTEFVEGARGAFVEGVPVHSVRLPGYTAHQEVVFGGAGEILTVRHDSMDRTSFMPGVVLAVRKVGALSGLVIGLDKLLEDGAA